MDLFFTLVTQSKLSAGPPRLLLYSATGVKKKSISSPPCNESGEEVHLLRAGPADSNTPALHDLINLALPYPTLQVCPVQPFETAQQTTACGRERGDLFFLSLILVTGPRCSAKGALRAGPAGSNTPEMRWNFSSLSLRRANCPPDRPDFVFSLQRE